MPTTNVPSGNEYPLTPTVIRDIERAQNGSASCTNRLVIDFETFYGTKYSLRSNKINYTEYVRDPRFAIMCVCVKVNDDPILSLTADEFDSWIRIPNQTWWDSTAIYAHNLMFDGLILAERYDIRPGRWMCTLALSRALFQGSVGADIDSMARFLGLPPKSGVLLKVKDRHWDDLTTEEHSAMLEYCANDVLVCDTIARIFEPTIPPSEIELIHTTLQQFLEPKLYINEPALRAEVNRTLQERADLIAASGVLAQGKKTAEDRLRSTPLFAEILREKGIEPPMQWSLKQEKEVEVFSKQHLPWLRMVNEWRDVDRTDLVALADARMNCASSIHITRPARLLVQSNGGHPIGAAYNYYGAHTGRWSGANKLNFQNFKRKGAIRRTITAPKGYVLCVVDASQIELRFNAWFCGEAVVVALLRDGTCVYRKMAGEIYGLNEQAWRALPSDSAQRFVGKVAMLGLGYGMSGRKFNDTLALGGMGPAVFLPQETTDNIVYNVYRPNHPNIVRTWHELDETLERMMYPDCNYTWKCLQIKHNRIILPNGMEQVYHDLRFDDPRSKSYFADGDRHNIYGGLFDENIIQALARIPMGDAMLRIKKRYPIVLHTHDELVSLVPESEADEGLAFMISELSTPPPWAPDIPLKAEGGYDYCYSK